MHTLNTFLHASITFDESADLLWPYRLSISFTPNSAGYCSRAPHSSSTSTTVPDICREIAGSAISFASVSRVQWVGLILYAAMAATGKTTKRKLYLQVSPHSVSIEFQPNAVSLSASLPALFLRISRGSRATESTQATLQGLSGSTYRASWMSSTLPINVVLSQDTASGKVERKEIKFQLKIASEGKLTHKSLAGCTYDISCLNLSALDYTGVSSETRQISLNTGKSAAAAVAIRAITLEATFRYEFLHDDFEISVEQSRSRETSPAHARYKMY